jgi:hypothetical protein
MADDLPSAHLEPVQTGLTSQQALKDCGDPDAGGLRRGFLQRPCQCDQLVLISDEFAERIPLRASGDQIEEPAVMRPDPLDVNSNRGYGNRRHDGARAVTDGAEEGRQAWQVGSTGGPMPHQHRADWHDIRASKPVICMIDDQLPIAAELHGFTGLASKSANRHHLR